jgi:hypothetical protein
MSVSKINEYWEDVERRKSGKNLPPPWPLYTQKNFQDVRSPVLFAEESAKYMIIHYLPHAVEGTEKHKLVMLVENGAGVNA